MKVLFLATPKFAVKFIENLKSFCEIPLVVTRPDAPSGRGQKLHPSPVKEYCLNNNINVVSPENPQTVTDTIRKIKPDIAVAVAYGKILKKDFFSIPKYGTLNVHFSSLPKYRGAAPIQWSLINGDSKTGVSVFEIEEGLDSGPIYEQRQTNILPEDNAVTLTDKLVILGIEALNDTLKKIKSEKAKKHSQKGTVSSARILTKKDSLLDFNLTALEIHNKVRGLALGPLPYVMSSIHGNKRRVQILKTDLFKAEYKGKGMQNGAIIRIERNLGFLVQCRNSLLLIEKIRPEGKKEISAWDFANGFNLKVGDFFIDKNYL